MKRDAPPGSEDFAAFNDFFRIFQKVGTPEDDDQYWNSVMKQVAAYRNKHDTRLGHALSNALLEMLMDTEETTTYCRWATLIAVVAVNNPTIADHFINQAKALEERRKN